MLKPCSLVTFFFYDTTHQRSNALSHLSIALMEAKKDQNGLLQEIKLVNSFGYYSHKIPDGAEGSLLDKVLKKVANVSFRIHGSYAEFKQEDLTNLDLGFGLTSGPIIEITSEERDTLERKIGEIFERQNEFFREADLAAKRDCNQDGKKLEDKKNFYREQHYKKAYQEVDSLAAQYPDEDFLIEETAYASGLISKERLQQEKLKSLTGIPMFEFVPSPNGSTCKTLGITLVMQCLGDNESGNIRKLLLSQLLENYYTQAIPLLTPGSSKIYYLSLQGTYNNVQVGRFNFPNRSWGNHADCLLAGSDKNTYVDLAGNEHTLQTIERKKEFFNLLENLFHLKRLLNDFATDNSDFDKFIKIIDAAVLNMMHAAHDIQTVIGIYHALLKKLDNENCFNQIAKNIFNLNIPLDQVRTLKCPSHLRLEAGVAVELYRLQNMARQAKKIQFNLTDMIGIGEKISSFFYHNQPDATSEQPKITHQGPRK